MSGLLHRLLRDSQGVAAIETALVAPVLILLSLGSFQISQMVARQHELSNGADEAAAMGAALFGRDLSRPSEVQHRAWQL